MKCAGEVLQDVFWDVLKRRGPFLAWKWLLKHTPAPSASASDWADYEGCMAVVLTRLRDFDAAQEALCREAEFNESHRWFCVLRADLLEEQDCRDEALMMLQKTVEQHPNYSTAICSHAELLVELERDDEALAL